MGYVHRRLGGKNIHGGRFLEKDLERAKRRADELIHEYEMETGNESKNKLNFFAFKGKYMNENTHITPFRNAYVTHGVSWNNLRQKWVVRRTFDGRKVYVGYFVDAETAKRVSDELVYQYENKIGKESNYKLNFPREQNITQEKAENKFGKESDCTLNCAREQDVIQEKTTGCCLQKRKRNESQSKNRSMTVLL